MKKLDLGQTLGILANFGVIAGIVFLAVELQQNNELLEAEIRTFRHNVRSADFLLPLENRKFANALIKQRHGDALTEYESLIMSRAIATTLYNYQYVFTEFNLGRIEEGTIPIDSWRLTFNGNIEINQGYWPDLKEYWEIRKHVDYDPAFVQWMDENIVNQ